MERWQGPPDLREGIKSTHIADPIEVCPLDIPTIGWCDYFISGRLERRGSWCRLHGVGRLHLRMRRLFWYNILEDLTSYAGEVVFKVKYTQA